MKSFTITKEIKSPFITWYTEELKEKFLSEGYKYFDDPVDDIRIVFNVIEQADPRPFRRKAQATFVISILEIEEEPNNIFEAAYPYLIRSLANHLIYIVHNENKTDVYFITPEQGFYKLSYQSEEKETFFQKVTSEVGSGNLMWQKATPRVGIGKY
jgi:hypothetical protein